MNTPTSTSSAHQPGIAWGRITAWALLVLMLVITLMPLWMAVKTALMHPADLYTESTQLLPNQPTLANFKRVLGMMTQEESQALGGSGAEINFARALGNSLLFTSIIVVVQVTFAAMAAYAFARLRFPGRHVVFGLFVASMMVPGVVTMIPNFILIKDLGLLNTMAGMVAPFCLMQGFSIFFCPSRATWKKPRCWTAPRRSTSSPAWCCR